MNIVLREGWSDIHREAKRVAESMEINPNLNKLILHFYLVLGIILQCK